MLFIILTYHNNLLKKMNSDKNYNFEKNSNFKSNYNILNNDYSPDEDQINHKLKWLRSIVINE